MITVCHFARNRPFRLTKPEGVQRAHRAHAASAFMLPETVAQERIFLFRSAASAFALSEVIAPDRACLLLDAFGSLGLLPHGDVACHKHHGVSNR